MSKRNRYTCEKCKGQIITEDLDEGTTPFMVSCRVKVGCKGLMQSSFYRGVGDDEPTTFVWRKPTPTEIGRASRAMLQHFAMGGLDIHPVEVSPQRRES